MNRVKQGDEIYPLETIRLWWKKIEKDTNKCQGILCFGWKELLLLKCPYCRKPSVDSVQSNGIFHKSRTNNTKSWMEPQVPWIAKVVLRMNTKAGCIQF